MLPHFSASVLPKSRNAPACSARSWINKKESRGGRSPTYSNIWSTPPLDESIVLLVCMLGGQRSSAQLCCLPFPTRSREPSRDSKNKGRTRKYKAIHMPTRLNTGTRQIIEAVYAAEKKLKLFDHKNDCGFCIECTAFIQITRRPLSLFMPTFFFLADIQRVLISG